VGLAAGQGDLDRVGCLVHAALPSDTRPRTPI
jgi:hypothetical protein